LKIIGDCKSWFRTEESPSEEALSKENIAWMKQELERCKTHVCAPPSSHFLPTRLLDLGVDSTESDVRLRSAAELPQDSVQYAALSYCWGTQHEARHQLITTVANLNQRHGLIPLQRTTRVVQDAIKTVRALSIRYLWIDALCIIQDDEDDWAQESEQMGLIYMHASVTICTLTSCSCLDGFLERPLAVNIGFQSKLIPEVRGIYSLRHQRLLHSLSEISSDADTTPWYLDMSRGGTWSHRGWTLQEKELSTRRLYFGTSRVYIHCEKRGTSEPGIDEPWTGFETLRGQALYFQRHQNLDALFEYWEDILHQYAFRSITHQTDKFAAISGLAKTMATEMDATYIAGLWSNDLPRSLLWKSIDSTETMQSILGRLSSTPLMPYVGPSWSWGSGSRHYEPPWLTIRTERTAHISSRGMSPSLGYKETEFRSECNVVHAWSTPHHTAKNPFGRIMSAELQVEGKLRDCAAMWKRACHPQLGWLRWQRWTAVDSDIGIACAVDFAVAREITDIQLESALMLLLGSSCGSNSRWPSREHTRKENEIQEDITTKSNNAAFVVDTEEYCYEDRRNAWGLILHHAVDTGKFVRIGVFRVAAEDGGISAFSHVPLSVVTII
jgi:hypothetical protein